MKFITTTVLGIGFLMMGIIFSSIFYELTIGFFPDQELISRNNTKGSLLFLSGAWWLKTIYWINNSKEKTIEPV